MEKRQFWRKFITMKHARRQFLQALGAFTGLSLTQPLLDPLRARTLRKSLTTFVHPDHELAAQDEDFWAQVRSAYTSSSNLINLNNGGVSPQTRQVQEKLDLYTRLSNEAPGFYMWRTLGRLRPMVKQKLGELAGCDPDTIAIQRNATESLETVINGLDLAPGDEIITTSQDYPSILNTLKMRERRHGIVLTQLKLPVPIENEQAIVELFAQAIGPRTKAIVFCHVINMTGQVLPARALCQMAREKGVLSIVDGAHSLCQLDFRVDELDCDVFASSLHKWLCAPFGTGMLHIRKSLIPQIWPMYGYPEGEEAQMSKFEHLGTRPFPNEMAISDAIDFHNLISTPRKEARLRYLKNYWVDQLADLNGFRLRSPRKKAWSCGIATLQLEGWEPVALSGALLSRFQVYTTAFTHEEVSGVRISPNVYTSLQDLDMLVAALRTLAAENKP